LKLSREVYNIYELGKHFIFIGLNWNISEKSFRSFFLKHAKRTLNPLKVNQLDLLI